MSTPEEILPTYETHGPAWARSRLCILFEKSWLDRLLNVASNRRVLDLGCGAGRPIATYLADRGCKVTGVDGAASMVEAFRKTLPAATVHHADMRGLDLGETFGALIAWDSFFHLSPQDQRAMFPVFARHAAPGAALMFTSGPEAGEAIGSIDSQPIYHASLAPEEYRALLAENGFTVKAFVPEDPACDRHTIWLAKYTANPV
ncbi:class I SAM-dependent methyltransferase [Alphaproteobacteria bacterium KMM 3653]|uniref:Class I SAM-dependent methyltransferase n=1 Tax=Harenicola maris TaxID=2841044 RepID=A0AAP2G724_9RHOB|nr:class I SAM-dependent methyltransferase [Harenicola maris]